MCGIPSHAVGLNGKMNLDARAISSTENFRCDENQSNQR